MNSRTGGRAPGEVLLSPRSNFTGGNRLGLGCCNGLCSGGRVVPSIEYVQGMVLMAFIGIPILYYSETMPGWLAFTGMCVVVIIGSLNSDRKV